ncbi:type I pullulanase [Prevotella sp. A2931]|uniref:Type I pullulanase n=1 Tax=Prevotella illustrans TaxID=2800387 RepID=A0ABS3M5V2_9BACT|nr:type I pullulanase [Prevotella illustrans]PTL27072.1 type I pullulanase [Prevotella sp. oral taxon 820]
MNLKKSLLAVFSATLMTQTTPLYAASTNLQFDFKEVTYTPSQTIFKLNAPQKPVVRIYADGLQGAPLRVVGMKKIGRDLWSTTIRGNLKGRFYTFDIGKGETPGIFAKAVGVNGRRGAIIDWSTTQPAGWENDKRPVSKSVHDLVIYELHHRDFSIDASSGITNKGKFLALTEPRAIEHLKKLGITAVHILPSFDYASVDETKLDQPQYNWGYDPLNYNVPEGSYSTNPYDPAARVKEFKQMVMALHKAGIRVFLDVVYNHTFDIAGSNFERTYPGYFYRYAKDGQPGNGSGCGNETASERPLMRQFMIESVKYWVNEYHIDGFRFDLMGVHDIETMNAIRAEVSKIDPHLFIYGEGWSAGSCVYPQEKLAMKGHMAQLPGIAAFSDNIRDALRGPFSDDTKGAFLAGIAGEEESLKFGIVGGIAHPEVDMSKVNYDKKAWTAEPVQHISYVSCHDDMCLVDRLRAEMPGISDEELIRLDLLAQTAVFTSQGVPFILSGEEMLRDKKGVHNSYNSPDSINRLDWNNLKRYPQVFDYYSRLIRLRKNHPAFGSGSAADVRARLSFLPTQDCLVGFMLTDYPGEPWKRIVVLLNGSRESRTVDIPAGEYTVVCRNGVIREEGMGSQQGGTVTVAPQSALILHN